jgi:PAS domain-containing protein
VILVQRKLFAMLALLCGGAVVFFGVRDYLLIAASATLTRGELKLRAETVLFLSIVVTILVLVCFGLILLRSRNISRELDKIADIARYGSFSYEESLRRIGPLGEKIRLLNRELTELNEMKTLRISSLTAINTFLLNNIRLAVLVTDITGRVSAVSPRCQEKLKSEDSEIVGRHISEVLPELDFQGTVSRLEKQRMSTEAGETKDSPTFYPIFNRNNELANIICVLGREEVVTEVSRHVEERSKPVSRVTSRVRRYLRSRRKRGNP